jgi:hypothetical protein
MKWIAIFFLVTFPSLANAEATVSQTPPHRTQGSDAHSMTEHRHRTTGEGQSARRHHDDGDSAGASTDPDPGEPDGAQGAPHAPQGATKPDDGQGI